MEALTLRDTQKLLETIHSLHCLKNPQTFVRDVLVLLEQLVPVGAACAMTHQQVSSAEMLALLEQEVPPEEREALTARQVNVLSDCTIHSPDPDFVRLLTGDLFSIFERFLPDSPLFQHAALLFTGAHKFSDFVTHQSLHGKEAFHDIFTEIQLDDHMLLTFSSEPDSVFRSDDTDKEFGYFYFYRNWNEWTERDRLILNLIQPHINQAFQSVKNFYWLDQQIDRLKEMFDYAGIILLDEQGYIQQISAQAVCWLYDYCPTAYYSQQLPEPLYTWFINQVTHLNSQVNSQVNVLLSSLPPTVPLRIQQENRQLTIRFNANLERRQYILLLTEEKPLSLQTALQLLGLTQREAEVLFWATQGQNNKAIATQLNISVSTVRKHLENIYLKLQVSSRTEAVTRSLEQVGLMNPLYL
ncbi:MAG: helix-turn-helix transcriptional regulator [Synechococcales cyanobacterium M58_A2018_015]|nr:helix-turn-helix transcriptional regulator [Synechococcales cyanobacterium M58_A2018_015]